MTVDKKIKIAVFECSNGFDPDRSRWGGYGGVIAAFLKSHPELGPKIETKVWNVKDVWVYPKESEYDVIVISGAPAGKRDWEPTLEAFIKEATTEHQNKKFAGFCFGHQTLAKARGMEVARNPKGWEVCETEIHLTEAGKKLFGGKSTLLLNEAHTYEVKGDTGKAQLLGSSDTTFNQGMYIPGKVFTLQPHPEFHKDVMAAVLAGCQPHLTEEQYANAASRNTGATDSKIVLDALAKFILSG